MGIRKKTLSAKDYAGPKRLPNSDGKGRYINKRKGKKRK